jgi:hypothetical protein
MLPGIVCQNHPAPYSGRGDPERHLPYPHPMGHQTAEHHSCSRIEANTDDTAKSRSIRAGIL